MVRLPCARFKDKGSIAELDDMPGQKKPSLLAKLGCCSLVIIVTLIILRWKYGVLAPGLGTSFESWPAEPSLHAHAVAELCMLIKSAECEFHMFELMALGLQHFKLLECSLCVHPYCAV